MPHTILGVAAVCADTEGEAEARAGGMELAGAHPKRRFAPLPSADEAAAYRFNEAEDRLRRGFRQLLVAGTPASVREQLLARAGECGASELMITCNLHDHAARLRSYELIAGAFGA